MPFELQPAHLKNEWVTLQPLTENDFEKLFQVASDPLIWELHPANKRYEREVFKAYFREAIESGGAFLIFNTATNELIGSSRYYDLNEEKSQVVVGATFLVRSHWGGRYNRALKQLMLDHAFKFVANVIFHIGAVNIRSQKAIEKLGAKKTGEMETNYHGDQVIRNFIYEIKRADWTIK